MRVPHHRGVERLTVAVFILSALYLCRVGYAVEVCATVFVFSLAALIVKGLDTNAKSE